MRRLLRTTRLRPPAPGTPAAPGTVVALAAAILATLTLAAAPGARDVLHAAVARAVAPGEDVARIVDRRQMSRPSEVVAADGTVLGHFRPEQLHDPLPLDRMSPNVGDAVVAAEDADFWKHRGVDVPALVRAVAANVRAGGVTQGGSTITQQLVKNVFTGTRRSLGRKVEELRLALAVESRHSKREILAAYLNTAYFGQDAMGIGAAARTYFGKPASELTLSEASLLAGILPSPLAYDPRRDPRRAELRRLYVLDRLADSGLRSRPEVEAARRERPRVLPPRPAVARYPFFVDYVRRWLLDVWKLDPRLLYGGGLRIETTLVPQVQEAARRSIGENLASPAGPSAAVVTVDPHDGDVVALAGGRDWKQSQVNLALGRLAGGSGRQPGSAFKPFVLAALFEQGGSLRDRVQAPERYLPANSAKAVENADKQGHGTVTVEDAIRRSINTSFVALADRIGPEVVARLATDMGVEGLPPRPGAAIGVGVHEVSPLDLATAYGAFANGGERVVPRPVQRVLDSDGGLLDKPLPARRSGRAVAEETARLVTEGLEEVIEEGTGTEARLDRPAAGKTGTTDEYTNAWFAGYTPHLATAVWVGFAGGNVPMGQVAGGDTVTGGGIPARIWRDVMLEAHRGLSPGAFAPAPQRPRSRHPAVLAPADDDRTDTNDGERRRAPRRDRAEPATTTTTEPRRTTTTTYLLPLGSGSAR